MLMAKIDKQLWQRIGVLLLILLATSVMTIFAVYIYNVKRQHLLLFLLCGLLYSVLLLLYMEWNRIEKGILNEKANNYLRMGGIYTICCCFTMISGLLPNYMGLVLVSSFLMTLSSTLTMGMIVSIYASVLLCISGNESMWMLSCYLMLSLCGAIIAFHYTNREKPFYGALMVATYSFCDILLFYCLEHGQAANEAYIAALGNGVISGSFVVFSYYFCYDKIAGKKQADLELIVAEHYSLVDTMKAYSIEDYHHARKVSDIAAACAELVGANISIAKAGGLYYRVGRLEGEPYIENGVSVALGHNFPPEITKILCEYNGEKEVPSTLESAIIHIVDNVVAKFEMLDQATLTSSWNQDIVVYQTLNDNSAQGLYDKAGLSMNMFLKIRDYLIKEAELF